MYVRTTGQSFYQSYQTYTKPTKTIRFGMHSPFTKPYTIQWLYSIVLLPNLTQFCDCTIESLPNLPRYEFLLSILDLFSILLNSAFCFSSPTIHFCCSACMSSTLDAFSDQMEPILPNQIQIVLDQCLNHLQQWQVISVKFGNQGIDCWY